MIHLTTITTHSGVYAKMPRQKKTYTEDDVLDAILEVHDGLSLKKSAQKYGIPLSTLSDRSRELHHQPQPNGGRLTPDEEARIVQWILRQEKLGYAPAHSALAAIVASILEAKGDTKPLGNHWTERFVARHSEITAKIGRRQESARFDSFTPKAVN